jgi:ribonuclease P protein component
VAHRPERRGAPGAGRRGRLSRSGDFERVYRDGRSRANRYLVLHAFPRGAAADTVGGETDRRLGLSVGRKVGGAVERNRVKRLLREAFWSHADRLPEGHDFVVVARPDLGGLAAARGQEGVAEALAELIDED